MWHWWLQCSNGVVGACLSPSLPLGGAGLLTRSCWLSMSRRLRTAASLGANELASDWPLLQCWQQGTISTRRAVDPYPQMPMQMYVACRRLRAALHVLAMHAAESSQHHAAAGALAAQRRECLLRASIAWWSDWAATRRRLRATTDLVRLCTLPQMARYQPARRPSHHIAML